MYIRDNLLNMTVGAIAVIQILPMVVVGIVNEEGIRLSPRQPEDLLIGDIGQNIKQMTVELVMSSLEQVLGNLDTALEQSLGAFDVLKLFFSLIQEKKIQLLLNQRYGSVMSSNFGLAMNTMIAFFQLMKRKMTSIVLTDVTIDPDLITQVLESPILSSYSHDLEMQYPSELFPDSESTMHKMIQSVVFTCNMTSFSTLVMLTVSLVHNESRIIPSQVTQIEQILRDWTLDILIQVSESLDSELDVRGPFNIAVPLHNEDYVLAEMGLDDYLERLE